MYLSLKKQELQYLYDKKQDKISFQSKFQSEKLFLINQYLIIKSCLYRRQLFLLFLKFFVNFSMAFRDFYSCHIFYFIFCIRQNKPIKTGYFFRGHNRLWNPVEVKIHPTKRNHDNESRESKKISMHREKGCKNSVLVFSIQ